jgi:4-carboxymuconolactone decarboxylase
VPRSPPGRDLSRTSPAPCVSILCSRPIAPARASGSLVTFEPGARTAWHTHPLGQILMVTTGTGRVQRWGDSVEEIRQRDAVWIPPGQKHWHGAAPNSSMAHIAIVEQLEKAECK